MVLRSINEIHMNRLSCVCLIFFRIVLMFAWLGLEICDSLFVRDNIKIPDLFYSKDRSGSQFISIGSLIYGNSSQIFKSRCQYLLQVRGWYDGTGRYSQH